MDKLGSLKKTDFAGKQKIKTHKNKRSSWKLC